MEIPGYRIVRRIGRGGMATVYAALQESLNRPVALKVLNESFADELEFTERFLNEGRVVASLNHRNIITIYDIDVAGAHHYLSMEYVEGGNLKQRLADGGVPPEMALGLVATLADCLGHAHRAGIVHRDVTPANILFREDDTSVPSARRASPSTGAQTSTAWASCSTRCWWDGGRTRGIPACPPFSSTCASRSPASPPSSRQCSRC
jgi:serine/threonine protein kinase